MWRATFASLPLSTSPDSPTCNIFTWHKRFASSEERGVTGRVVLRLLQLLLWMTCIGATGATGAVVPYGVDAAVGGGRWEAAVTNTSAQVTREAGSENGHYSGAQFSPPHRSTSPRTPERHFPVIAATGQIGGIQVQPLSKQQPQRQGSCSDRPLSSSASVSQQLAAKQNHLPNYQQVTLVDPPDSVRKQQQLLSEGEQPASTKKRTNSQEGNGTDQQQQKQHAESKKLRQNQRQRRTGPQRQKQQATVSRSQEHRDNSSDEPDDTSLQERQSGQKERIKRSSFTASTKVGSQEAGDGKDSESDGTTGEQATLENSAATEQRKLRLLKEDKQVAILCAAPTCSANEVEDAVKEIVRRAISLELSQAKHPEAAAGQQNPFRNAVNIQVEEESHSSLSANAASAAARRRGDGTAVKQSQFIFWNSGDDWAEHEEEDDKKLLQGQESDQYASPQKRLEENYRTFQQRVAEDEEKEDETNSSRNDRDTGISLASSTTEQPGADRAAAAAEGTRTAGEMRERTAAEATLRNAQTQDRQTSTSSAGGGNRGTAATTFTPGVGEEDTEIYKKKVSSLPQRGQERLLTAVPEGGGRTVTAARNKEKKERYTNEKRKKLTRGSCAVEFSHLKHLHCHIIKFHRCSHYINMELLIDIAEQHPCIEDAAIDARAAPYDIEEERRRIPAPLLRGQTPAATDKDSRSSHSYSSSIQEGSPSNHPPMQGAQGQQPHVNFSRPNEASEEVAADDNKPADEDSEETAAAGNSSSTETREGPSESRKLSPLDDYPRRVNQRQRDDSGNVPNDPLYAVMPQWELRSRFISVQAPGAWLISKGGKGYISEQPANTVGIIDFGFHMRHEDLWDKWWRNTDKGPTTGRSEWPANCDNDIDDDENGYVDDCFGYSFEMGSGSVESLEGLHGTEVAGICCADTNNSKGVAAIGWNLRPMALQTDGNYSQVAEALNYAADKGVKVLNFSMGGPPTRALRRIVMEAENKDILLVVAAGNHRCNLGLIHVQDCKDANGDLKGYPAAYSDRHFNLISVGASDAYGRAATFSNYDATPGRARVQVVTPGTGITACSKDSGGTDVYSSCTGTSFAAPFVTGIAGLMRYERPDLSARQVREILVKSCVRVPQSNLESASECGGLLSAAVALQRLDLAAASSDNENDSGETRVSSAGHHQARGLITTGTNFNSILQGRGPITTGISSNSVWLPPPTISGRRSLYVPRQTSNMYRGRYGGHSIHGSRGDLGVRGNIRTPPRNFYHSFTTRYPGGLYTHVNSDIGARRYSGSNWNTGGLNPNITSTPGSTIILRRIEVPPDSSTTRQNRWAY